MPPKPKIKIGWFSFSCCEDNTIVMTEVMNDHWQEWKELFDFRYARVLKSQNTFDEFDIAFIEGALAGADHEARAKEIRERAKKVVAVGACAVTGLPAGNIAKVKKVSEVIKVDVEIPGCPMSPEMFLEKVNNLITELHA